MNKQEILNKIDTDMDYIPSLDEYRLIANDDFTIGEAPIFTLTLSDMNCLSKIADIEKETRDNRPEDLYELYSQLSAYGYCKSYREDRIYYIAYTLAQKKINFEISGMEYKMQLDKKRRALTDLKKQLEIK